jgi:hypothetical protein
LWRNIYNYPQEAGIRLGIIIRAFVILIKVHYKQERTHNITIRRWNSGFGYGRLGTRYTTGEAGTNDKSILYWNRYGQVGINNNSPEYNLDVVGSSRITESLNVGGISNFSSDVNITAETSSTGYLNGALTVAVVLV